MHCLTDHTDQRRKGQKMGRPQTNRFEVGDKVLLQLGVDAKYAPRGLKRWDGCVFRIEKINRIMSASVSPNWCYTYHLQCCRSQWGEPYTIMEDWLAKVK